jgi:tyrosyl-tRNA synthetase
MRWRGTMYACSSFLRHVFSPAEQIVPQERKAQNLLAEEVTRLVHGSEYTVHHQT